MIYICMCACACVYKCVCATRVLVSSLPGNVHQRVRQRVRRVTGGCYRFWKEKEEQENDDGEKEARREKQE
ncbi:MAG: hypothetical protein MR819_10145 [Prevotella sp.]|nr:hypothetical protein [Prevotella sp.]